MKNWSIAPLILGRVMRDKSFFTYLKDPGVKIELGILAWLLMNGEEKVIVDTGPPILSKVAEFHEPFYQTIEESLEVQLARFKTSFDQIKVVVNTHLHWDHCYGNSLFKDAHFYIQRKEINYARNPLPVHLKAYEVGQDGIVPPFEGIDFDVLEGDFDLIPGIRIILTPGHTPGMQAVCVQTREGVYIIAGDTIPLFENMKGSDDFPFLPSSIFVNLEEYFDSLDRIKRLGGFILPGHDLRVLEKDVYP